MCMTDCEIGLCSYHHFEGNVWLNFAYCLLTAKKTGEPSIYTIDYHI